MEKTAVITGASRGIGKAIAYQLAKESYNLILICQSNMTMLQKIADELSSLYSIHCRCYQGNIGDSSFVQTIFSEIDRIDILINNAGISHVGLLQDMSDSDWHNTISVNLDSVFFTSRGAIPLMLKNGHGKIINISSVWGNVGASTEVAYSASKGGVNAFTKALSKELAPSNIQVNALACGFIDTDMNAHLTEEDKKNLINEIPADRIGQPDEVAAMVVQIINSPSYLTGQIITMDGGWI